MTEGSSCRYIVSMFLHLQYCLCLLYNTYTKHGCQKDFFQGANSVKFHFTHLNVIEKYFYTEPLIKKYQI